VGWADGAIGGDAYGNRKKVELTGYGLVPGIANT
jgi:hypothetical protein